jgi:hypothetical protein
MKILYPALLICATFLWSSPLLGGTYHIAASGNDANAGSFNQPWRTIGKANGALQAGDTVVIRGGTYADDIQPLQSGVQGKEITFRSNPGDIVTLTTTGRGLYLSAKAAITIEGLRFIDCAQSALITHSNGITIRDCIFHMTNQSPWTVLTVEYTNYFRIYGGRVSRPIAPLQVQNDVMNIAVCNYTLVDGTEFYGAQHYNLSVSSLGSYNIVRNIYSHDGHGLLEFVQGGRWLAERNLLVHQHTDDTRAGAVMHQDASNGICRFNIMQMDTASRTVIDSPTDISGWQYVPIVSPSGNRDYNNTRIGFAGAAHDLFQIRSFGPNAPPVVNNHMMNNIFHGASTDRYLVMIEDPSRTQAVFDFWVNNSLWWKGASGATVWSVSMADITDGGTLARGKSVAPSIVRSANIEGDPGFVDPSKAARNYSLSASSPAIDAGGALTTALGSGSVSASLTVVDASWFCDGWGLVEGDSIKIGSDQAVRVVAIAGNAITLSEPRTWSTGASVYYWPFSGNGPDIGALEFQGSMTPPPLPPPAANLVANAGFTAGTMPWVFYTDGAGGFSTTTQGYGGSVSARIGVTTAGTNTQLYQAGLTLDRGTRYRLSFAARSSTGHDMSMSLIQQGAPYASYGLSSSVCDLQTEWKEFSAEFTTPGTIGTVTDARLLFWLASYASAGDEYMIDNVVLSKVLPQTGTGGTKEVPAGFALLQNYPNPFNPSTSIDYSLPTGVRVTLRVFDLVGREVATLADGYEAAGHHSVRFDGGGLASGVYIYRLETDGFAATKRMLLIK